MFSKKPIVVETIMPSVYADMNLVCRTSSHKKDYMKPTHRPDDHIRVGDLGLCYGFVELQKKSLVVRSWQDWSIKIGDNQVEFSPSDPSHFSFQDHTQHAVDMCNKNNMYIMKIEVPIAVRCPEDIDFILTPSPFMYKDIGMASGVCNFKYQDSCNLFLYIPRLEDTRIIEFNLGDPLFHIVPLADRKIKHLATYDDGLFHQAINNRVAFTKHSKIYRLRNYFSKHR